MLINTSHCNLPDKLSVADVEIERVNVFKLLGVHINRSLKWDDHVSAICNKAASRIYFLKQLKRSSVDPDDLYHFYTTVIRPITGSAVALHCVKAHRQSQWRSPNFNPL